MLTRLLQCSLPGTGRVVLLMAGLLAMWGGSGVGRADEPSIPRRALLVGIARYQHLPASEQLRGCVNDVEAMRTLLQERYGFSGEDIITLVNEQATGAAIRAELEALVTWRNQLPSEGEAAQVVFHFSGHGSQLPDQPDGPDRDEEDGLDETLVPYDAQRQGGAEDLRDDEVYAFTERLCGQGQARLWVVLDCCHSGTGARGATRVRKLTRNLPARAVTETEGPRAPERRLPPGAVVLSACRAREVEPEYDAGGTSYGLLTKFLVQVLYEEPRISELNVDLLREAIVDRYRRDPAVSLPPMPQLEGAAEDLRNPVFGSGGRDRPAYWAVVPEPGDRERVSLKAGRLHGVTRGSRYELYDDPAAIDWTSPLSEAMQRSSLWIEVESTEGTTSRGRVFRWYDGEREEDELPRGFQTGYAVERFHQHGDYGVRLRIVRAIDAGTDGTPLAPDDAAVPEAVRLALRKMQGPQESSWVRTVTGDEACDLLLRIDGEWAALFPATGAAAVDPRVAGASRVPAPLRGGWGPIAMGQGEEAARELVDAVRRVARARNLLRIAHSTAGSDRGKASSPEGESLQVGIELLAVEEFDPESFQIRSARVWPMEGEQEHLMRDGALYALRVTNRAPAGGSPMYVTILQVDADMGISQVLPWQEGVTVHGDQYLEPGESLVTDPFQCNGDPEAQRVYGRRRAVVLATRGENHFYMLQQPSLPRARGSNSAQRIQSASRSLEGPPSGLESLLLEGTYFQPHGAGRRSSEQRDGDWSAAVVEWNVTSE